MITTIAHRYTRMPAVDFIKRREKLLVFTNTLNPSPSVKEKDAVMMLTLGLGSGEYDQRGYAARLGPFVIDLYGSIIGSERPSRFPPNFWQGDQGLQNLLIIGKHVLETDCGLRMGINGSEIDPRLFPENQTDFLKGLVRAEDKTWSHLFDERRLISGIRTQKISQLELLKLLWPEAFDTTTPAEKHLDPWWFPERNEWKDSTRQKIDFAISHTLEVHFGMLMDREKQIIDPRLFSDGSKDYLTAQGFKDWSDLAEKAKLFPMVNCVPAYKMSLMLALRSIYSWAFDLKTVEGKHLHFWQIFSHGSTLWSDPKDIIAAVRHEALVHDNMQLMDLPHKFTVDWLRSKGLIALMHQNTLLNLIHLCFKVEISRGLIKIEELDYLTDNYKIMDHRGRVMVENIRYCFPKPVHQLLAKRIDKDNIGLYKAKDKDGNRVFELKYTLDLTKLNASKNWHNLEMADLIQV